MKYIFTLIFSIILLFGVSPYRVYGCEKNIVRVVKLKRSILIFSMVGCKPCRDMERNVWPKLKNQLKDFDVYHFDNDKDIEYVKRYKVDALPTVILVERTKTNKGKELKRFVGYRSAEEVAKFLETTP